ncbi:unnamed protein product [Allacma fusca]|uniref:Glucuronosyltransferase n=1 Tax=Allacma fusca TaxID=39272 RepID=A0A8J2K6W4_9HEXA|nr:unnamed protein product [Allacma fusca]
MISISKTFYQSVLLLEIFFVSINSENILVFIGIHSSYSHRASIEPLAYKLAERGHNVTFLNPERFHQTKRPNLTEFCPPIVKVHNDLVHDTFGVAGLKSRLRSKYAADLIADYGRSMFEVAISGCEATFRSFEMQQLLKTTNFDLIIVDKCSISDCIHALGHKLGAKVIEYQGLGMLFPWDYFNYGIPLEPWRIPMFDVAYETEELTFLDRIKSMYSILRWYYVYQTVYLEGLDKMTREVLNIPEMPPLKNLVLDVSLILFNFHPSDHFVKSIPPFVVPAGGMHLQDSRKPLPRDLETFIQESTKGFIYISFGSIIKISTVPPKFVQVFLEAMESLKDYQFLWKWEGEKPENVSSNVMVQSWFPQQDVLAHPKIRGFISQGGQISVQQAVHNGVPLILFPVNGDQDFNAKRLRSAGNGIDMELFGLTADILRDSVLKLVEDKSYSTVAAKLKRMSRDRPMSPVDTAVWWTEYVLRHDDTRFLKPTTKPWWMILSVDIVGFVAFILFMTLSVAIALILKARQWYCKLLLESKVRLNISIADAKKKLL